MGQEDAQVVPPLRGNGVPLKGERSMIPLQITGKEIIIEGNHVHMGEAVDEV